MQKIFVFMLSGLFAAGAFAQTTTTVEPTTTIFVDPTKEDDDELLPPPGFIEGSTESSGETGGGDPDEPVITGAVPDTEPTKESDEKAGTEDINIGVGELEETTGGYLKIDDIAGEAEDAEPADWILIEPLAGAPPIPDTRPAAETAPPPGQSAIYDIRPLALDGIVHARVEANDDGSVTVRGQDYTTEENRAIARALLTGQPAAPADAPPTETLSLNFGKIDSQVELIEYAGMLITADERVEEIDIKTEGVTVSYAMPADILWIIPVQYTARIDVDSEGRVKVKQPWWLIFAQNAKAHAIREEVERQLVLGDSEEETAQHNETDFNFLRRSLGAAAEAGKTSHDTTMAVIRNLG